MRRFSRIWFFTLLVAVIPPGLAGSLPAQVSIGVSVRIGPPMLPVYVQPVCPAPGYLWTPGYWAWGPGGYYWVPGAWVLPPEIGVVWTPGYWGWGGGFYVWHAGYWGPHVGFYGGVNYGYGYPGRGYYGGYWRGRTFYYNRTVNHVNVNIRNVYVRNVTYRNDSRVSYNGGRGGIMARETAGERRAYQQRRFGPTARQQERHNRFSAERRQPAGGGWQRFGHPSQARPARGDQQRAYGYRRGPSTYQDGGRQAGPGQQRARDNQARNYRGQRRQNAARQQERNRGQNGGRGQGQRREQHGDHGNGHGNGHGNDHRRG